VRIRPTGRFRFDPKTTPRPPYSADADFLAGKIAGALYRLARLFLMPLFLPNRKSAI
jgi:hypothetical protein